MTGADFERFVQRHDPEGRADYTFRFRTDPGESLNSAVVDVVDETSTTVDAATDLVIESTAFGLISPNVWGVTIWVSGGGDSPVYYLRCRVETTASPSRKADKTMRLFCEEL
jgi:hypothetical protein